MRWDDLKFFLAVARTGQLTTAAKGLKVDNATVARRIRALETALDARLFERNPKGYSLTEVGQRLLPSAEAMETTTLQAQAQLQGRDDSLEGVVRLGAPDGFGSFFLAPRIHKLAHRHPKLELQLVALPRVFSLAKREAVQRADARHVGAGNHRAAHEILLVSGELAPEGGLEIGIFAHRDRAGIG